MPDLENLLIYKENVENGSIPFFKEEYKTLCQAIDRLKRTDREKENKYA